MIRALAFGAALACAPLLAAADAGLTRLYDLLMLEGYVEITQAEAFEEFDPLAQDMLGRPPSQAMTVQLRAVYDTNRLSETLRSALETMPDTARDRAAQFYGSDKGTQIAALELSARRAMSGDDVEEAAKQAWAAAQSQQPSTVAQINALIDASDLVERNVSGALGSNLRFFQGLAAGGALQLSEREILNRVYAQEPRIRSQTEDWLGAYMLLAYSGVPEEDVDALITFWRSEPGRALNAALFDGFNTIYDEVSYATGRILALNMGTQDL